MSLWPTHTFICAVPRKHGGERFPPCPAPLQGKNCSLAIDQNKWKFLGGDQIAVCSDGVLKSSFPQGKAVGQEDVCMSHFLTGDWAATNEAEYWRFRKDKNFIQCTVNLEFREQLVHWGGRTCKKQWPPDLSSAATYWDLLVNQRLPEQPCIPTLLPPRYFAPLRYSDPLRCSDIRQLGWLWKGFSLDILMGDEGISGY